MVIKMNTRELIEQRERQVLSPFAAYSDEAVRRTPETRCSLRTEYQRDRDRILHSKAFRRLKHKTQVYIAPGDHYRTRMTHTLEVSQIARTIARALCLNEDLTEAIALGHDVGHTPFGHVGEFALRDLVGHFNHNEQSLHVLDDLEKDGRGLNLTEAVREGIVCHTGDRESSTLEGRIVRFCDRIAYLCHDFDDAMRAGMLTPNDLPSKVRELFGSTHSSMITAMVSDIVKTSAGQNQVTMTKQTEDTMNEFRSYMFEHVYEAPALVPDRERGYRMVQELCKYYLANPDRLPADHRRDGETTERDVVDYVAGLTDHFAIKLYKDIFIPRYWDV